MKVLKFADNLIPLILSGEKKSTWRLFDDKDLSVGDEFSCIGYETGAQFAQAKIISMREKRFEDISVEDEIGDGHEQYLSPAHRLRTYQIYYKGRVLPDTIVKMIRFEIL